MNWKVVGAADMNADGQLDLVWSHRQSGAVRIWHLDGLVQIDIRGQPGHRRWQGNRCVTDMTSDGRPDLWVGATTEAARWPRA